MARIDCKKTFGSVQHQKLWAVLKGMDMSALAVDAIWRLTSYSQSIFGFHTVKETRQTDIYTI